MTKHAAQKLDTVLLRPDPEPRNTGHAALRVNKRAGKVDEHNRLPILARAILFIGGGTAVSARATAIRRSFPIMGYVGPNGGGKSLAMVKDTLPSLAKGRTCLSTVELLDPRTGQPAASYVPFTDFEQLLDLSHADVLMDEIVGIANSRSAASLPVIVQNVLVQLRRRDICLRWTAPNWARSDKIIREVTQAVTECRGSFPGRSTADSSGELRLWAPKRLFSFRTYDTIEFEEWSAGKRDKAKPKSGEWFRGPGSDAFASYDTLNSVAMVSHAAEDGMCSVCGLKKRTRYCGEDHTVDVALEVLERVERRGELDGDALRFAEVIHDHATDASVGLVAPTTVL